MSQGIGQLLSNTLLGKDDDDDKNKNKELGVNPADKDRYSEALREKKKRDEIEKIKEQENQALEGNSDGLYGDENKNKTRKRVASLDEKNSNTEKAGPYVIDPEEKERQRKIIEDDKAAQEAKDKYNAANLAASNESAAFEKANPKVVGTTKAERRRTRRDNKKAFRRANKSGEEYGTAQWDANFQAEKDLIADRREKRKEYLRNFASQLTRGVQADQSDFKTKSDINFFKNQKTDQAKDNNKESKPSAEEIDKKSQIETYENNFRNILGENSDFANNNFNRFLNLPKPELDTDRDSMGNNFTSEYFKRRGY
tara:strand:+ start:277 stop:1212 length:936 start_codon:yes stop_codon:yes gene_type:complete